MFTYIYIYERVRLDKFSYISFTMLFCILFYREYMSIFYQCEISCSVSVYQ